jgi:hypothetical protein
MFDLVMRLGTQLSGAPLPRSPSTSIESEHLGIELLVAALVAGLNLVSRPDESTLLCSELAGTYVPVLAVGRSDLADSPTGAPASAALLTASARE